jgi:hypothetical protein
MLLQMTKIFLQDVGLIWAVHFTEVCSFRKFIKVLIEAVCQQLVVPVPKIVTTAD